MKFKSLLFVLCFSLVSSVFANASVKLDYSNRIKDKSVEKSATNKVKRAGYCEIEVINYSETGLNAWGRTANGGFLHPTYIPSGSTLNIDLTDYDFAYEDCPYGMNLNIETTRGALIYSKFTYTGETITVYPAWGMLKTKVQKK